MTSGSKSGFPVMRTAPLGLQTPYSHDLAADLRSKVKGEVRFDEGSRALYATDASNYRQVPIGVVVPRSLEDVVETIAACRRHDAPVLSRGAGTSLAGQCCNVAVVIDMSKFLNRIVDLDPAARRAHVLPGVVLDDLRSAAERHGLTFGPDPATHNRCTLGGMIGNNSCGVHSVMAGRTVDNVHALDVLTYDGLRLPVSSTSDAELQSIILAGGRRGEIYSRLLALRDRYAPLIRTRYPKIPRRVSGYNLDELLPENGFHVARALVGTEGTCVTVLGATLRLVPSPPHRVLLVLGYESVFTAAEEVPEILSQGAIGLEGLDDRLVESMMRKNLHVDAVDLLPEGKGWLLVELGGESLEEASDRARAVLHRLRARPASPHGVAYSDPLIQRRIWKTRESALAATAQVPGMPDTWEGWEDSAVPPERLGSYLRELGALFDRHGYRYALYGHFGDGCVHTRIDFDFTTHKGVAAFRAFLDEAADLVVAYGGSLSGEHGDGQARAVLLPKMFGEELVGAFREFKAIWDPQGRMNPGKIVDANEPTENLRIGPDRPVPSVETHFRFPGDIGGFSKAVQRCVGVGECRKGSSGTMCPSFMVTREERDSTRGRAHLLFEMLQEGPLTGGWRSKAVKEALDLCLACKACKSECPVNVDMASYKSEFLAHYYAGRLRPRSAYAMGWIHSWCRLAALAPGLANLILQSPVSSRLAKWAGGIAAERAIPTFARQTFRSWFEDSRSGAEGLRSPLGRGDRGEATKRVILWPDTFTNHFQPHIARAAVETLEASGFRVEIPPRPLCCGRPLYDYGFLGAAKRLLGAALDVLGPRIADGTPIVGLEPSCVAVFRDEISQQFPDDPTAERLRAQTFLLSELLQRRAPEWEIPKLPKKALVQGHCHQRAVLDFQDEVRLLERLGLDFEVLDSGCCGMAGSFGFESGPRHDLAQKCGERALFPAVRAAASGTLIIANGFSCREQIVQSTGRRAVHIAEVLRMALGFE